jgi:gliding motility-associated-like protein
MLIAEKSMFLRSIFLLSALLFSLFLTAQTCDNPISLCGGDTETLSEFTFTDLSGIDPCLTGNDMLAVARFHTTYINTTSGVTVSISGLECMGGAVKVMVVQPNPLDYCDTSQYSVASSCQPVSGDTTFETDDLYVNTDYLILVSYQTGIVAVECSLEISVSGEPLSIIACCPQQIDFLESADLDVMGGDGGIGYVWSPTQFVDNPASWSVTATPPATTVFQVTGFVENCQYSDDVLIVVGTEIDVPDAFSPNDDEINDLWKITGLSSYSRSRLTIYDRWGQQVFRSIAYPLPWNGESNGTQVPVGTYYYVIELNEPGVDLEPITGNVAVIR